jgi:oligosaccharide repeat unit polymerase
MKLKHPLTVKFILIAILLSAYLLLLGVSRGLEGGLQGIFTFFLVIASLLMPVVCCINKSERGSELTYDFFQPGVIVAVFYYLYIVMPGIHIWYNLDYVSNWIQVPVGRQDVMVNYTFMVAIIAMACFGLGYRSKVAYAFASKKLKRFMDRSKGIKFPNDRFIKIVIFFLIIIGVLGRLYIFYIVSGSGYSIKYLSPSMRSELDIRISGILVLVASCLDWGALLLIFRYIITRKLKHITAFMVLLAMVSVFFLSGKRSDVLPFLFFPVVWYHYLRNRISFRRGLLYLVCGFFMMASLLFVRILGPLYSRALLGDITAIGEIIAEPFSFYFNSPELAVFDITMVSIMEQSYILGEIGGWLSGILNYNFSTILFLIPRFIWEAKPVFIDLGQVMFRLFISGTGSAGFAVGIFAGLYLFGGLIGIVMGMTFIGVAFRFIYIKLSPWRGDPTLVFVYPIALWMIFQFCRFGTMGFMIMFFIQKFLVGTAVALLWLYIRRHSGFRNRGRINVGSMQKTDENLL